MSKFLITLTPADYYFFGGENTFDTFNNDESRNYLVRSNLLPQQTALVGLVRHILLNNGLKIGDNSFCAECDASTPQDFGVLKKISPLFLQHGTGAARRFLLPASKLWLENEAQIEVNFSEKTGTGCVGSDFRTAPKLSFSKKGKIENYTSKEALGEFWMFADDGQKVPTKFERDADDSKKDNGGIFISALHIGIDKMSRMKLQKTGGDDDEAFYKQEFLRLHEGFRFAFVAEFDDPVGAQVFNTTMPFGGENRTFSVEATAWTADFEQKIQLEKMYRQHGSDCIVLASDAFVKDPQRLFTLCQFSVVSSKPFRSIRTPQAVYGTDPAAKNWALSNLHHGKSETLLHLLERGSVFFPKTGKATELQKILTEPSHFRSIGYNHFYPNNLNF